MSESTTKVELAGGGEVEVRLEPDGKQFALARQISDAVGNGEDPAAVVDVDDLLDALAGLVVGGWGPDGDPRPDGGREKWEEMLENNEARLFIEVFVQLMEPVIEHADHGTILRTYIRDR